VSDYQLLNDSALSHARGGGLIRLPHAATSVLTPHLVSI